MSAKEKGFKSITSEAGKRRGNCSPRKWKEGNGEKVSATENEHWNRKWANKAEEMDGFVEGHKWANFAQEETRGWRSPVSIKSMALVIKNLPAETPGKRRWQCGWHLTRLRKQWLRVLSSFFPSVKDTSQQFSLVSVTETPEWDKDTIRKKKDKPISLTNKDAKSLRKHSQIEWSHI